MIITEQERVTTKLEAFSTWEMNTITIQKQYVFPNGRPTLSEYVQIDIEEAERLLEEFQAAVIEYHRMDLEYKEYEASSKLKDFLETQDVIPGLVETAIAAYKHIFPYVQDLKIPNCSVGPDDNMVMFTWDKDEHHLEVEVYPTELVEWFYLNHTTNEMWEATYVFTYDLSERFILEAPRYIERFK